MVPSEEANYSQQGYAGKGIDSFFVILRKREKEREERGSRGLGGRSWMESDRAQGERTPWYQVPRSRSPRRLLVRFQTGFGARIRTTRNAVALKAMWQAAHPGATANRCLEIQIYRPRCSRAPAPPGKSDLCRSQRPYSPIMLADSRAPA